MLENISQMLQISLVRCYKPKVVWHFYLSFLVSLLKLHSTNYHTLVPLFFNILLLLFLPIINATTNRNLTFHLEYEHVPPKLRLPSKK